MRLLLTTLPLDPLIYPSFLHSKDYEITTHYSANIKNFLEGFTPKPPYLSFLFKGGGILWHIRGRSTQNRILSAQATFIDGLGWFLVWWFLFSSTTPKSGNFSVQSAASAAAAAVTAKLNKTQLQIMWYINSRLLDGGEFKNKISFPFRIP